MSFPKSISSIEKQTLLPIDETDDRYCGYSLLAAAAPLPSLSYFFSGGFEYPIPVTCNRMSLSGFMKSVAFSVRMW